MSSQPHFGLREHVRADIGSARLMLAYLGKAAKHYAEREFAKKKVKIELSRLKKISTGTIRNYVKNLERNIAEAINKEQSILKHQGKEDTLHGDIAERIEELEGRLNKYLAAHEERAHNIRLLESALANTQESKSEQVALIKRSIAKVERIFSGLRKEKGHSRKQLASLRKLIDRIKAKVKQYEKKK
jgi:chromosome segregation ATPase